MQGSVKTAGRVLLTGALAALAGCGGSDIPEVQGTYVRLQEIRHYSVNTSGAQTQLWRQHFSYLDKSTPDKMVYYSGKGADALWNTDDDAVAYYSSCAFTGKVSSGAKAAADLDTELVYALTPLFTGFPAAVTGMTREDLARSCAINYNNQSALTMKVFNKPGTDGKWLTADDDELINLDWQFTSGVIPGTTTTVKAPTVAGYTETALPQYYYYSVSGLLSFLVRTGTYQEYAFDTSKRPSRITTWSHVGSAKPFAGPQGSDIRQEYTDYEYGPADLVKCRRDLMGSPVEAVRDAFVDGLLNERQYFDAGLDGTPCTGDDAVIAVEKFVFEKI
jgi:hypothetical protein